VVGGILPRRVNPLPQWLGQGHDATPWRAVQYAAIDTLIRTEEGLRRVAKRQPPRAFDQAALVSCL
jgi:hypothetical protein